MIKGNQCNSKNKMDANDNNLNGDKERIDKSIDDKDVKDNYRCKEKKDIKDNYRYKENKDTRDNYRCKENKDTRDNYRSKENKDIKDNYKIKENKDTRDNYKSENADYNYKSKENKDTRDNYKIKNADYNHRIKENKDAKHETKTRDTNLVQVPKYYQFPNHHFPLDLKFDSDSKFESCPICLLDNKDIKECVMLNCMHRFCLPCITDVMNKHSDSKSDIKECTNDNLILCPLCRSEIWSAEKRITLFVHSTGDQIWWHPNSEELKLDIKKAIIKRLHNSFGCIHTLNSINLTMMNEIGKNYIDGQTDKLIGRVIQFCHFFNYINIRGYTRDEFNKLCLKIIIVTVLQLRDRIYGPVFIKHMKKRWPALEKDNIIKCVDELVNEGYCRIDGKTLHYQHLGI